MDQEANENVGPQNFIDLDDEPTGISLGRQSKSKKIDLMATNPLDKAIESDEEIYWYTIIKRKSKLIKS